MHRPGDPLRFPPGRQAIRCASSPGGAGGSSPRKKLSGTQAPAGRSPAAATRSSAAVSETRMCAFPAGPYMEPGPARMPHSAASNSHAAQQSSPVRVAHR